MDWTPWRELSPALTLSAATLRELLDGGQAFRWREIPEGWEGVWGRHVARLRLDEKKRLAWSAPAGLHQTEQALRDYLGLHDNWDRITDALPWRSDAVIAHAVETWKGLRILRQPLGETLLTFLCSSTKQIAQIKQISEDLAAAFGQPITSEHQALPDWQTLHEVAEDDLRACRLGYRARYLKGTAAVLAEQPGWLEETGNLSYPEARTRLMQLPGVGGKIADCVLLFGTGKLEAFPVDTWMIKAMTRHYDLQGWKPEQVAQFGRVHFGPYAGLAQQILFTSERRSRAFSKQE